MSEPPTGTPDGHDPATASPADGAGPAETTLRLLFWNVYLLAPRLIPHGPALPALPEVAAPAVPERAAAIGRTLAGQYEVVAMAEAFEPVERRRAADGWKGRPGVTAVAGPERSFPPRGPVSFASSGLFTVVDGRRVTRTGHHRYRERGAYRWDADAWSNKGVLLTELDPFPPASERLGSGGRIELYSTHLCWGTGILGGAQARDVQRRHRIRMTQVEELLAYVERTHRPQNTALVVGDFNVRAHDVDRPDDPSRWYRDLAGRMEAAGFVDAWAAKGVGPGHTCGPEPDPFDEDDPTAPGRLRDDPDAPAAHPDRERIDYLWVQRPEPAQELEVSFDRPRRRAFPRPAGAKGRARLARLSDHLAVELTLRVRRPRSS